MNVKLGHLELFVQDPLKSMHFYCDILGFQLVDNQNDQFIWVKSGAIEILLRPGKSFPSQKNYGDSSMGIVLYTSKLEDTVNRLKELGVTHWGQDGNINCPTFTDLDGHWFQLVDPNNH